MNFGIPGIPMIGPTDAGFAPMEQPKQVFRYGEACMWSAWNFPINSPVANSVNRLFSTPISMVGQGWGAALTIAETNIKESNRIPNGQSISCFAVACQVYPGASAPANDAERIGNLLNFQNNCILTWDFSASYVDIGPVAMVGGGGGAYGSVSAPAALANVGHLNNGAGGLWVYRKHPVLLPGASVFCVQARFGGNAAVIGANFSEVLRIALIGNYLSLVETG